MGFFNFLLVLWSLGLAWCPLQASEMFSTQSFDLGTCLGEGAQGAVRLATIRSTNTKVALKTGGADLKCEVDAYRHLKDTPGVLRMLDSREKENTIGLVLEYASHGSLQDFFNRYGPLNPLSASGQAMFRESVEALINIHQKGLLHLDIKPANMFFHMPVGEEWQVLFGDLGSARSRESASREEEIIGTPHYIAPEVYRSHCYSEAADWWSLAVSYFQLFSGTFPHANTLIFDAVSVAAMQGAEKNSLNMFSYALFFQGNLGSMKQVLPHISQLPVAAMFDEIRDMKTHAEAEVALDLLRQLMTIDPEDRLQGTRVLEHPYWQRELADVPPCNPFLASRK